MKRRRGIIVKNIVTQEIGYMYYDENSAVNRKAFVHISPGFTKGGFPEKGEELIKKAVLKSNLIRIGFFD